MNRKNIKKVRDVIAGLPRKRFRMDWWSHEFDANGRVVAGASPSDLKHECDTAGCIGGWTNAILGTSSALLREDAAALNLGLTEVVAEALFYPPTRLDYRSITPAHAVRVLDHLLETGEVDWKSTRRAKKPAVAK